MNVEVTPAGAFRARVKVRGKVLRGRSRKTAGEAAQDARDLAAETVPVGGPETLSQAFAAILDECRRRRRRPQTARFYEEQRKAIEGHFGSDRQVSAIRREHVQAFVDAMLDRGNSPATVDARLRGLRRAFLIAGRRAIGKRELVVPDAEEPDPASFLTLKDSRRLLQRLEADDDLPACDFWVAGLLLLTGARKSEIARMRKEDIAPERVLIRHGKKRPREQPLPGNASAGFLVDALLAVPDRTGGGGFAITCCYGNSFTLQPGVDPWGAYQQLCRCPSSGNVQGTGDWLCCPTEVTCCDGTKVVVDETDSRAAACLCDDGKPMKPFSGTPRPREDCCDGGEFCGADVTEDLIKAVDECAKSDDWLHRFNVVRGYGPVDWKRSKNKDASGDCPGCSYTLTAFGQCVAANVPGNLVAGACGLRNDAGWSHFFQRIGQPFSRVSDRAAQGALIAGDLIADSIGNGRNRWNLRYALERVDVNPADGESRSPLGTKLAD